MPRFSDVSHVSLSVRDAEKTASWWKDVFGLRDVLRGQDPARAELGSLDRVASRDRPDALTTRGQDEQHRGGGQAGEHGEVLAGRGRRAL